MAYERVNWENLPSTKTPVNADNLNKMDEGINSKQDKLIAGTGIEITGENIINNLNANYSTNEQKIGKWIDGKPLYRRTIIYTNAITKNTPIVVGNISNFKEIISINYTIRNSAGNTFYSQPLADEYYVKIQGETTTGDIYLISNDDWGTPKIIINITYTKTTD